MSRHGLASRVSSWCPLVVSLMVSLSLLVLVCGRPRQAQAEPAPILTAETYAFVAAWDGAPPGGTFKDMRGAAADTAGNVYIVDTGNHRIQVFTATGQFLRQWGQRGWAAGQLARPVGIAVDGAGTVYVADEDDGFNSVHKYTATGVYLGSLPEAGAVGVAVDGSNNVYVVVNTNPATIAKYNAAGQKLLSWTTPHGHSIAADPRGFVYVGDTWDDVIRKFDFNGNSLGSWSHEFGYSDAAALAVDSAGHVVALCMSCVAVYAPTGQRITQWWQSPEGGWLSGLTGVAAGPDGSIYVCDGSKSEVQRFTGSGQFLGKWGSLSTQSRLDRPEGLAVIGNTLYVADALADRIQVFSTQGSFLRAWNTPSYPSGVAIDGAERVYLSNPGVAASGSRTVYGNPLGVRVYDATGTQLSAWAAYGEGDGQSKWPSGIAIGPDGLVYLADTVNNRVQVLNSSGGFVRKWTAGFNWPQGIAVASDGSVYVADTINNRILKFTPTGGLITSWGGYGNANGKFNHPKGIALDGAGYVYVADGFNHRVQKFTANGVFVTSWGMWGTGNGQFDTPLGIALDDQGYVYVADTCNGRIQKFERIGPTLTGSSKQVSAPVAQPGAVLTYTITLSNSGRVDAVGVRVTDTVPAQTTVRAGSLWASAGTVSQSGGTVLWTGPVSLTTPVTIRFAVTVSASAPSHSAIINRAIINDGVVPPFERTATTLINPYRLYLPVEVRP